MANLLEQAIDCNARDRGAKIIQDALGIKDPEVANRFPKIWPGDREGRARMIGEWLHMETYLVADVESPSRQMAEAQTGQAKITDERQPGCFALEEERGENWKGVGATPGIREAKPSL